MLLVVGFVALVVLVAWAFDLVLGFGPAGLVVALVVAGGAAAAGYWKSDTIALAMSGAKPADPVRDARLINLVEGLCIAGGLPMPRVYVVDDPAPNAFATGRNPHHAAVAVTTGLLDKMTRVELEGILAHELSHVKNYDILVSTLAVTLVGVVALLADWGMRVMWWTGTSRRRDDRSGAGAPLLVLALVLLVFAPIVAKLMQLAVSRRREALADVTGVQLTRYPPGLISALEKLRNDTTVVRTASRATAHLWIEEPLALHPEDGRLNRINRLFMTHPPLDERIRALKEL